MKDDAISRQAALDCVYGSSPNRIKGRIVELPSAQPGCEDTVYRKAVQMLLAYFVPEERYAEAVDELRRLPSAQPTDRNGQARTAGRKWTEVMQMPGLIERQTIVAWYTPEEKIPPEDAFVVVIYSGRYGHITYDHTLGIATWADDGCGWLLDGAPEGISFTVHAWADLEPYKGGERHD